MDTIDYSPVTKTLVDLPEITPPIITSDEEMQAVQNNWYLMIPPFEKGVIRVNRDRYFLFTLESVDTEEQTVKVDFDDFIAYDGAFVFNHNVNCIYSIKDEDTISMAYNGVGMSHFMEAALEYESSYDERLKDEMRRYVLPQCHDIEQDNDDEQKLANVFMAVLIKTNLAIQKGKPKKTVINEDQPTEATVATASPDAGTSEKPNSGQLKPRILRAYINGIEIKSRQVPKVANAKTIRNYSVASWNRIGHTRTYKNGKTVYIKPVTAHRKCLIGSDQERRKTVIMVNSGARTNMEG